ncbi:MAG: alpha/beta hydrolase [Acidimicrobiales bacterium]|jgi:acetyl esterase/lipase|nr:alpha/beta hydrolase [Acidimicrobiales bacterium]|tara:strand:+ start:2139 stop:3065 length:927 start_codon:yes stop_codon:yes gene_type:complete
MPIDPMLLAVLEAFPMQFDDLGSMTAQEVRALFEQGNPPPGEDVASVEDLEVPGPDGPLPVRVYRPDGAAVPAPVVVFFHGGGWVLGSIATHDATCRGLANRTGAVYVSVDYRLAPEHPYPAAPEDCYAATCWVADHAADLGVDPGRLAVAGDSAGGNLAAVVCQMARDRSGPAIAFQLLIYPVTDLDLDRWPSMEENADGPLLTREGMDWFARHYVGTLPFTGDPYAAPIRAADLSGLPPAYVATAGHDPLRDEGAGYAEALAAAGVTVGYDNFATMIHGFVGFADVVPAAGEARDRIAAALAAGLA